MKTSKNENGRLTPGGGLAIGIGVGAALGVAMGKLALGIAIGIALGLALGVIGLRRKFRPPGTDDPR